MSMKEFKRVLDSQPEMKSYFETLPANIRENIFMTAPKITSLDQLKSIVMNLTNKQG